jgi:transposase
MPQISSLVGLDVCGEWIDACALPAEVELRVSNDAKGYRKLIAVLRKYGVELAVCEASGGCERGLVRALQKRGMAVRVEDPRRVRHFAKAMGRHAKNDRIDARVIAEYARAFPQLAQAPDREREALADLVRARQSMSAMSTQVANQMRYKTDSVQVSVTSALANSIDAAIAKLDQEISARLAANDAFAQRAAIISSVPGVGPVLTAALIAKLPELGQLPRHELASLVGVAPMDDESGKRGGHRHITGGRKLVRNVLYMATLGAATQHNPVLCAMYQRLLANGKEPKVALVACMRKMLHILNTMVARQQTWNPPSLTHAA